jgi:L-malate glycosyltransferase
MIRVLHVVVAGDIGGAERLLIDLCLGTTESHHSVLLMTPNATLVSVLREAGLTVFERGLSAENPLAYVARSFGGLPGSDFAWGCQIVRRHHVQIIHQHTLGSHVLGTRMAKATGLPTLRTEHHYSYYEDWSAAPFSRYALKGTARVVAISDFIARYLDRNVPAALGKVVTIRNGVDPLKFPARPSMPPSPGAKLKLGVACRLESWKGLDLAIEAVAQVADVELWIAGEGSQESSLRARAQSLGCSDRVHLVGRKSDVSEFYSGMDCVLNTSLQEPLGLSALEGLATGRPVLAFAQGGILEIIEDGATGFLVTDRSVAALRLGIARALAARKELPEYGARARGFVERQASTNEMCRAYDALYRELLNEHTPAGPK